MLQCNVVLRVAVTTVKKVYDDDEEEDGRKRKRHGFFHCIFVRMILSRALSTAINAIFAPIR